MFKTGPAPGPCYPASKAGHHMAPLGRAPVPHRRLSVVLKKAKLHEVHAGERDVRLGVALDGEICPFAVRGGVIAGIKGAKAVGEIGLARVGWAFTFTAAAYNLIGLPKVLEASG